MEEARLINTPSDFDRFLGMLNSDAGDHFAFFVRPPNGTDDSMPMPSIGMMGVDPGHILQHENATLCDNRAKMYGGSIRPADDWEEQALSSEMGLPTRVLQGESEPFAALLSAVGELQQGGHSSVLVYQAPINRVVDHRDRIPELVSGGLSLCQKSILPFGQFSAVTPFGIKEHYLYYPPNHICPKFWRHGGVFLAFPNPGIALNKSEVREIRISLQNREQFLNYLRKYGYPRRALDAIGMLNSQNSEGLGKALQATGMAGNDRGESGKIVLLITALSVELEAVFKAVGVSEPAAMRTLDGTKYWEIVCGNSVKTYVSCIGSSGNVGASSVATALISTLHPELVMLTGIAGGMRGKCVLGEVVIAEMVVAYEPAALVRTEGKSSDAHRPETYRLSHVIQQDITSYLANGAALRDRLDIAREKSGLTLPLSSEIGEVSSFLSPRLATLASGEKLLRDSIKFEELRVMHHKIEVVEMEAVGVISACHQADVHHLIIRGISDFGDDKKDRSYHEIAALTSALVAVDFIANGLGK